MPRRDAATRLERRGIVAWRVGGALARLTASQSRAGDLQQQISKAVVQAGAEAAIKIRKRVTERGDLARQQPPPYSDRYRSETRAERAGYVRLAGAPAEAVHIIAYRNGNPVERRRDWYRTSADFHSAAHVRDQSYRVTGGMWAGLQARGTGKANVILDFAGSSLGANDENLRNNVKAYAIYKYHRIHILKLKKAELVAMGGQIAYAANSWLERHMIVTDN